MEIEGEGFRRDIGQEFIENEQPEIIEKFPEFQPEVLFLAARKDLEELERNGQSRLKDIEIDSRRIGLSEQETLELIAKPREKLGYFKRNAEKAARKFREVAM